MQSFFNSYAIVLQWLCNRFPMVTNPKRQLSTFPLYCASQHIVSCDKSIQSPKSCFGNYHSKLYQSLAPITLPRAARFVIQFQNGSLRIHKSDKTQ